MATVHPEENHKAQGKTRDLLDMGYSEQKQTVRRNKGAHAERNDKVLVARTSSPLG